jgi:MoxR-like ATPase
MLADEINRTPPKTQAALLEAMEERQVTVEGSPRELPDPFLVAATQNPVEYEGTYPLPEAQLDRFLLKLTLPLPPRDDEIAVLTRHAAGFDPRDLRAAGVRPVASAADLEAGRAAVRRVQVKPEVLGYVVDVCRATRQSPSIQLGVSPRGATALLARLGRGRGCRAATTSPPTTSRRSPGRRCATASRCAPKPSSRASPPTRCSTACWPRCPCRGDGRVTAR